MLLQQIFTAPLTEAINAAYGFDVYQIIEDCAAHVKTAGDFRALLNARLGAFFRTKLRETAVRKEGLALNVHISEPMGNYQGGGVFRTFDMDHNISDDNGLAQDGLPPVPDKTTEMWVFVEDGRLEGILQRWHNYTDAIQSIGATLIHEFVHLVQYLRANGDPKSLNRYTVGVKRGNKDGKRVGKRGEYVSPDVNPQAYYGTAIEIDAHAATAAAEIVHRARREPPDQQRAYLEKVLRSLRENSPTIMTYRDKFKRAGFFFGSSNINPKKTGQIKRQKELVWKSFRLKLAKHLLDYIASLPAARHPDFPG